MAVDLASLMRQPVWTVTADTPLPQARALMTQHGIRHLPVVEAGTLVGLLTDRLLRRAEASTVTLLARYEQAARLEHLPVKYVMTRRLIQRPPDTPAHEAAWLLWEGQSESILIVERGVLLGIVTASDLIAVLAEACERRWPPVYRKLLVPLDVCNVPGETLGTALALARACYAHLTLLYVLVPFGHTLAGGADHLSTAMLEQIDEVVGILTTTDLLECLSALLKREEEHRLDYVLR